MVMVADISDTTIDMVALKEKLGDKGAKLGVRIDAQHEDAFKYMHRI